MTERWDKIAEEVRAYLLRSVLDGEDPGLLQDSTALISSGIMDSISTAKLVSYLEEKYDIRFKAHEVSVGHLDTIAAITETTGKKIEDRG